MVFPPFICEPTQSVQDPANKHDIEQQKLSTLIGAHCPPLLTLL